MYKAYETTHSGCIVRFTPDIIKNDTSIEIERKIRHALDNKQVFFNLQPQYDMNHKLRGFEALARIKDISGKPISPVDFIPVAEKAGLIDSIDREVFTASANFFGKLLKKAKSDLILSVNVSVHHLLRMNFIEEVKETLASSGLPAKNLEIEITESVMIESVEKAMDRIKQIKAMGISIAIDDFGTGYSSLSYLSSFPADVLKIDRSFIVNMGSGMAAKSYVAAIIAIGHIMKYKVIAEGVETQGQYDALSEAGNDYIQGFLWGKPLEPEEASKLVSEN
jgi:EAL domain-containing protein (putative c-di-GMP-specific phosphodiesterase class I)